MSGKQNVGKFERISSASLAGAFLLAGLKQAGFSRVLFFSTAGFLAYRAGSGYCPAYDKLALDSTSVASRPTSVRETITILADPDRAYNFVRNLPKAEDVFTRFHLLPSGDEEGQVLWRLDLPLEKSYSVSLRLFENEAARSIALDPVSEDSPISKIHFRFDRGRADDETKVTLEMVYKMPGGYLGNRAANLLQPAIRNLVRSNLMRLKNKLEAGEIPTIENQTSGRTKRRGQ